MMRSRPFPPAISDSPQSLKTRDRELASKGHELASAITTRMAFEIDDGLARYLELIFIVRHLEQIGNLSTNLGDEVVLAYSNVSPMPAKRAEASFICSRSRRSTTQRA